MQRVLIVTNECYLSESANGYCIENVVSELEKAGVIVDVVAFYSEDYCYEVSEKTHVYYIRNRLFNTDSSMSSFIQGVMDRAVYHFVSPDVNYLYAAKAIKKIKQLINQNEYNLLISSSGGFSSQYISMKIFKSNKNNNWVPLFFDPPVSINFLYKKKSIYYHRWKKIERDLVNSCKKIILETSLCHGMENIYGKDSIFVPTGLPLVINREIDNSNMEDTPQNRKRFVFFGTLWRDIRNPDYAIKLLTEKLDCSIDFYGGEATKKIISEYNNSNVHYCGIVKHREIYAVASKYDYLLNLSNTNAVQTPSKLFEYISFCMPIVNIIQDPNDITKAIVEKYGNGISILKDDAENVKLLEEFFIERRSNECNYFVLKKRFNENTPEYTCKLLLEELC